MTQRALSRISGYSRSLIAQIEGGSRNCTIEVARVLDIALGTSTLSEMVLALSYDDPITRMQQLGSPDMHRRTLLTTAGYSTVLATLSLTPVAWTERVAAAATGKTIGMTEVEMINTSANFYFRTDEQFGGGYALDAMRGFLHTDVAAICRGMPATPQVRAALASAVARINYIAGFKSFDAGQIYAAQQHYRIASDMLADVDELHLGFVRRLQGCLAMDTNNPRLAPAYTQAAIELVHGKIDPTVEAAFASAHARALACAGHAQRAMDAAKVADHLSESPRGEVPWWVTAWGGPRTLSTSQLAGALTALGDHQEAKTRREITVASWDPEINLRPHALSTVDLGHEYWHLGDRDGAIEIWAQIMPRLRTINSKRVTDNIADIEQKAPELIEVGR